MLRRLDLLRIPRTHRRQVVRVADASLQQIDIAEILDAVHVKDAGVIESDGMQRRSGEAALIAKVVDRENSFDAVKRGVVAEVGLEIDGRQRGLPIVAVDDIGTKDPRGHGERGARQNGKTRGIIAKIAEAVAVESVASVKRRADEKQIGDAIAHDSVESALIVAVAHPDGQIVKVPLGAVELGVAVRGQQHHRFVAALDQCGRQRAEDVGESAGFGERGRLGGHHQDLGHSI